MKGSSIKPGGGTAGRRALLVGVTAACAAARDERGIASATATAIPT